MIELNRAVLPVTDHEPDLTLLTAGEGSRVYMRRWWLRRQLSGNGYGRDGLYAVLHRKHVQEWGFEQPDGSIKPVAKGLKSTGTALRR